MSNIDNSSPPVEILDYVKQLKSNGTFDQFRRDCLSDIDSKPAFQALKKKVENFVKSYFADVKWNASLKKSDLRESLRKKINESGILTNGLNKIVEQVVNPKIETSFRPVVEKLINEPESFDLNQTQTVYKLSQKQNQAISTPTTIKNSFLNKSLSQTDTKQSINTSFPATFSLDDSSSNLSEIIKNDETILVDKTSQIVSNDIKLENETIQSSLCQSENQSQQQNESILNKSSSNFVESVYSNLEKIPFVTDPNIPALIVKSDSSYSTTSSNTKTENEIKINEIEDNKPKKIKTEQQEHQEQQKVKKIIKTNSNIVNKTSTSSINKNIKTTTIQQKKTTQSNNIQKIVLVDTQTLKSDPKNEYHFDWKLDVCDETNISIIDELSASSVHTSDISDFDEFDFNDINIKNDEKINKNENNKKISLKKNDNKKRLLSKSVNEAAAGAASTAINSDSDRSRSCTRRKRSLNPKYYSYEFTQDYRNRSKSRSRSKSSNGSSTR